MPVSLPEGLRPNAVVASPLETHRSTAFVFERLDRHENLLGRVYGVEPGGKLNWYSSERIKGGGNIVISYLGQEFDWLNDRIRISITVNGYYWPLGVWIPTAPTEKWANGNLTWDVELHDKLTILDEDAVAETFALDAGTVVTGAVADIIEGAGEARSSIALTESTEALEAPLVWPAGTPKLTIINDLLNTIGYYTLRTNGYGQFEVKPYLPPYERPVAYTFIDGETAIYTDEFRIDQDIFAVPNRVVAVAQGSGSGPAPYSIAENRDPESPFSREARGRWITRVYTDVEASSQESLDTYATKRLVAWSTPAYKVHINHAPVPLSLLDAILFRNVRAGIGDWFVVDATHVTLEDSALQETRLRQVSATVSLNDILEE